MASQCDALRRPRRGNDNGVLYYQVPSNTGSPNFNGVNVNFSGLLYCPGATSVNFNGAKGNYLVLVFGAVNYNGSATWDFATPRARAVDHQAGGARRMRINVL